jgi:hypothetical protein
MAALTSARSTIRQVSSESPLVSGLSVPVKAATKCIQGGIAVANAGYAAPGTGVTGLVALGIFEDTFDNTGGANGAINARIRRGVFKFNILGGDALTQADMGATCFIEDDNTVRRTSNTSTRSAAGKFLGLDTDGLAWVEIY